MADRKNEFYLEMFQKDGYRTAKIDDLIDWLQSEKDAGYTWVALDGTLQMGDGAILWSNVPQI